MFDKHHSNVKSVQFENTGTAIRMIAFFHDPELDGARSVLDILEAELDNTAGIRWIARVAAEYTTVIGNDTEYFFYDRSVDVGYGEGWPRYTLDDINTGRARKLQSRIERMIDLLPLEKQY